jgi:hypothetical protein
MNYAIPAKSHLTCPAASRGHGHPASSPGNRIGSRAARAGPPPPAIASRQTQTQPPSLRALRAPEPACAAAGAAARAAPSGRLSPSGRGPPRAARRRRRRRARAHCCAFVLRGVGGGLHGWWWGAGAARSAAPGPVDPHTGPSRHGTTARASAGRPRRRPAGPRGPPSVGRRTGKRGRRVSDAQACAWRPSPQYSDNDCPPAGHPRHSRHILKLAPLARLAQLARLSVS